MSKYEGSCYCGAVQFETDAPLVGVINCHCKDCQKMHGNYNAMAGVARDELTITGDDLVWYKSSDKANRGFCGKCGSRMFKDNIGSERMMISMGAFSGSTGLRISKNIFTESAGDWYDLPAVETPPS
jgi:hypothetical protein